MINILKKFGALLPLNWQYEFRRFFYSWKLRSGTLKSLEPEYAILESFIKSGDLVIDIGANIGHYSSRFSRLVGEDGIVIAIEPVLTTFSLLSNNARYFPYQNTTLLNLAITDEPRIMHMNVPVYQENGLSNYYYAHLSEIKNGFQVLCMPLDALSFPAPIKLVKIDAEGVEKCVLLGMKKHIDRDHPVLIIENDKVGCEEVLELLENWGYENKRLENSPNVISSYRPCE